MFNLNMGLPERDTLDNLMEGFQVISFDWRYLYVNDAVVKQSKCTKKELLGHTMMEKYPGIENTSMFKTLQRCMKERVSIHFENEFTYPDNSKDWFELSVQPIPEGIFILSIDITERKKAEQQRKEYTRALEEMIHMTSHKVRQPVAHILGISSCLDDSHLSSEDVTRVAKYMKESAETLDNFTRELNTYIRQLQQKARHSA